MGTVPETHMLKPYDKRVDATYKYMLVNLQNLDQDYQKIKQLRIENLKQYQAGKQYGIRWKIDSAKYTIMDFKGFEGKYKPSEISGKPRLYYDRSKPFTKNIRLFTTAVPTGYITIPKYYVIPQSQYRVIEEFKRNRIQMKTLQKDSTIAVESYRINDFKTVKNPYEGHYLHFETTVDKADKKITFSAGDYIVQTDQEGVKYIIETLEPEALDSFFNWNFFDGILAQKEYYSAYIFEDTAAELLKKDKDLKQKFEARKAADKKFADDGTAQLDWIYRNSPYFEEKTFRQYPIYRIL